MNPESDLRREVVVIRRWPAAAMLARTWTLIGEEAERDWRTPSKIAYGLFLLPIAGAILVILSRASKPLFKYITGEDRLLEWGQFAFYLVAAVLAALVAVRVFRSKQRVSAAAWSALALVLVLIAGEEIDWGQRVFDFKTGLERFNEQAETTIHNVGNANALFAGTLALAGLYGALAPWIVNLLSGAPSLRARRLFVPPLYLTTGFGIVFAYRFVRWAVLPEDRFTLVEVGEWPEFCFALGVACFALLNLRLLRSETASARLAPVPSSGRNPSG